MPRLVLTAPSILSFYPGQSEIAKEMIVKPIMAWAPEFACEKFERGKHSELLN